MTEAKSAEEQCNTGYKYARDILYAAGTRNEQVVALSALNAYSQLVSLTSAVNLFYTTFNAVMAGIPGPMGAAAAKVALSAMSVADREKPDDSCSIAMAYATLLQQNTEGTEKKLIDTAITAYGSLGSAPAGAGLWAAVFKAMKPWGYHIVDVVMGTTGLDAMNAVKGYKDKSRVGFAFTKAILDNSASISEKAWAQYTLDEYAKAPDSGISADILRKYLTKFTSPLPPYPVTSPPLPPSSWGYPNMMSSNTAAAS